MTFGKVLGGGLPVGAFAANSAIMDFLAPEGPVYQAGTHSGNPLAMAAGFAMLNHLSKNPEVFVSLNQKTQTLHQGMQEILEKKGIPYQINRYGSMLSLHFTTQPVVDFKTAALGDNDYFKKYFHGMLDKGIYLPPSAFESYFLNDALSDRDIDKTITALDAVISSW
jgi:glutamate-1-semialdehyde 2,1-aminomutase